MLLTVSSLGIAPSLYSKVNCDPINDFATHFARRFCGACAGSTPQRPGQDRSGGWPGQLMLNAYALHGALHSERQDMHAGRDHGAALEVLARHAHGHRVGTARLRSHTLAGPVATAATPPAVVSRLQYELAEVLKERYLLNGN